MIEYQAGSFGFQLLFRMHGSAVFKSLTPAIISSAVFLLLYFYSETPENYTLMLHPYPMGALIAALTFLLAYRANFSYQRYWEAFGNVHHMHSKWLDMGMELASFHLQASCYAKPPAFGAHPQLVSLQRERERLHYKYSLHSIKEQIDLMENPEVSLRERVSTVLTGKQRKSQRALQQQQPQQQQQSTHPAKHHSSSHYQKKSINAYKVPAEKITKSYSNNSDNDSADKAQKKKRGMLHGLTKKFLKGRKPGEMVTIETAKSIPRAWPADAPPLFLQEAAHLLSLLSAVAMSTLRNDLEQAESPLIPFIPNEPWPHVDPDAYTADVRENWESTRHHSYTVLRYWFGLSRTPASRTLYNAARPFRVIGGISDAEIELLQAARGPLAKYALCTMWIAEFITREYLNGATGNVAPPIISRLYQFLSDGGLGYNQARKIAYTPFPFPHAQITSLFILIVIGFLPVLMLAFLNNFAFAFCLNFLTVLSFTGVHEVARELESPFQNVPNDVPLNNFQAQFNEALMTMFFGYHPDAFWQVKEDGDDNDKKSNAAAGLKTIDQTGSADSSSSENDNVGTLQAPIAEETDKDDTDTQSQTSDKVDNGATRNKGGYGSPNNLQHKNIAVDNEKLIQAANEKTPLVTKGLDPDNDPALDRDDRERSAEQDAAKQKVKNV